MAVAAPVVAVLTRKWILLEQSQEAPGALAAKAITIKIKRLRGKQAMADLLTTGKHALLNAIPYCNCFLKVLTLVILGSNQSPDLSGAAFSAHELRDDLLSQTSFSGRRENGRMREGDLPGFAHRPLSRISPPRPLFSSSESRSGPSGEAFCREDPLLSRVSQSERRLRDTERRSEKE